MTSRRKVTVFLLLVLAAFGGFLISSRPHWLKPRHGRVTCAGHAVVEAKLYRSQRGDIFVYAPSVDGQLAVVSPQSQDLGRCNPAFTPLFGLLFTWEAEPSVLCTSMWKGAASNDVEPPHIVTEAYADFPWGSCPKLRIDY
jgi:hypothetical protein